VVRAIGMDVHRDVCEVAIAEAGTVGSAGRIATRPASLERFAASLAATDVVALEVTGNAGEIARILSAQVARVVVVSPHDTGISRARAKTDRLDARALAKLLAAGELDAVWMPDEWTRAMRRRLARRDQLVRARTRAKHEIHAVLIRRWRAARRSATCSACAVAGGCLSWSCPPTSQRRSPGACATSTSSTRRSPHWTARSPVRRCAIPTWCD